MDRTHDNTPGLRPVLRTTSADAARQALSTRFARHELRVLGRRAAIAFTLAQARLYDTDFTLVSYGAAVEIATTGWRDFYLVQLTYTGVCELELNSSRPARLEPGSLCVINPGTSYRKRWSPDAQQLIVRLPRRSVDAATSPDGFSGQPVLFDPTARQQHCQASGLMRYLWTDLATRRPATRSQVIDHSAARHLLTVVLHAVPNSAARPVEAVVPVHLQRAERHLRRHLASEVSIDELASVCGVGMRALQEAFRRHWHTTPTEYLRALRMEEARRLLTQEPLGASVAEVARRVGVPHLGRFSHYYRNRFGELPSQSLRQSRDALADAADP